MTSPPATEVVTIPSGTFVSACLCEAIGLLAGGRWTHWPVWLLATEVMLTVAGLFLLGSFRFVT